MEFKNSEEEEGKKKKGIENGLEKMKNRQQSQFRLVLGKDAIEALEQMVSIINDGFTAGHVSKADLATYLFKNAHRFVKKPEVIKIRNEFFDEKIALENLVKESEGSGKLPDDLRKLLRDQYRMSAEKTKGDEAKG